MDLVLIRSPMKTLLKLGAMILPLLPAQEIEACEDSASPAQIEFILSFSLIFPFIRGRKLNK